MAFEDFKTKDSVVVVYTGEGKGKTSASLGLMVRALGANWKVAYIQFVKFWEVNEHKFIAEIQKTYGDKLYFFKGGKGFYKAGDLSAKNVTDDQHIKAAEETYNMALDLVSCGKYDLVICDEINNAVHDGLLKKDSIEKLIKARAPKTSLCLTGRNFPKEYLEFADIASEMKKLKHHFDDKYLANPGIDY